MVGKDVMNRFDDERFRAVPVVGILRGLPPAQLDPVVDAVIRGGLTTLEITMNSPSAVDQIRAAVARAAGRLNIGAGTVTSVDLLEAAIAAGASFVVTPHLVEPVVLESVRRGVPVFPGAFSPSEIGRAWELGARLVKVFPGEAAGEGLLASVVESMPGVRLMPTGGVDLETLPRYRAAGAGGYGVGSPLFRPEILSSWDWPGLAARCASFVAAATG